MEYQSEGMSPHQATEMVSAALNLPSEQKQTLHNVLNGTDEDPILVIGPNEGWINQHGWIRYDEVLESIANFNIGNRNRRDYQVRHLCFHFSETSHIAACRVHVHNNFPEAFAMSQLAVDNLRSFNIDHPGNREPMGFAAVVHKIQVRCDDVETFPFFYF